MIKLCKRVGVIFISVLSGALSGEESFHSNKLLINRVGGGTILVCAYGVEKGRDS